MDVIDTFSNGRGSEFTFEISRSTYLVCFSMTRTREMTVCASKGLKQ